MLAAGGNEEKGEGKNGDVNLGWYGLLLAVFAPIMPVSRSIATVSAKLA